MDDLLKRRQKKKKKKKKLNERMGKAKSPTTGHDGRTTKTTDHLRDPPSRDREKVCGSEVKLRKEDLQNNRYGGGGSKGIVSSYLSMQLKKAGTPLRGRKLEKERNAYYCGGGVFAKAHRALKLVGGDVALEAENYTKGGRKAHYN